LGKEQLENLFEFNVQVNVNVDEGTGEPSSKLLCVKLNGEVSKNELGCNTQKELLRNQGLVVNIGLLDDTPPTYSPFYQSKADLFMYCKMYYKGGVVTSATCVADKDKDEYSDEIVLY